MLCYFCPNILFWNHFLSKLDQLVADTWHFGFVFLRIIPFFPPSILLFVFRKWIAIPLAFTQFQIWRRQQSSLLYNLHSSHLFLFHHWHKLQAYTSEQVHMVYIFQLKSLRTLGWYVRAQGEAHCTLRSLCAGEGTRASHHPQMIVYSFTSSTVYKFTFLTFEFTHPGLPNSWFTELYH